MNNNKMAWALGTSAAPLTACSAGPSSCSICASTSSRDSVYTSRYLRTPATDQPLSTVGATFAQPGSRLNGREEPQRGVGAAG